MASIWEKGSGLQLLSAAGNFTWSHYFRLPNLLQLGVVVKGTVFAIVSNTL